MYSRFVQREVGIEWFPSRYVVVVSHMLIIDRGIHGSGHPVDHVPCCSVHRRGVRELEVSLKKTGRMCSHMVLVFSSML